MVFSYGSSNSLNALQHKKWFVLELSNEKTIEPTIRRLGHQIPSIFREHAVEIFVPVSRRDLDVFELSTTNYLFIRTMNNAALLRLKTITGIVAIVTEGEAIGLKHAIMMPDDFIQEQIKDCEEAFFKRAAGIKVGSFVRVIEGHSRDFCGIVTVMRDAVAVVQINLLTRSMLVETPTRNLLNLSHVPERNRVFYYGPMVEELEDRKLLRADHEIVEDKGISSSPAEIEAANRTPERYRGTRQRTVTALVKRLIDDGMTEPMEIAKCVVDALKRDALKRPKNWFIVYCIIKDHLVKRHSQRRYADWRELARERGVKPRELLSAETLAAIDPTVDIPLFTLIPLKDGRSREARLKKKAEREAAQRRKQEEREAARGKRKIAYNPASQPTQFKKGTTHRKGVKTSEETRALLRAAWVRRKARCATKRKKTSSEPKPSKNH